MLSHSDAGEPLSPGRPISRYADSEPYPFFLPEPDGRTRLGISDDGALRLARIAEGDRAGPPRRITPRDVQDADLALGPDGTGLAFWSDRGTMLVRRFGAP